MQPTHARWEQIDDNEVNAEPQTNGHKTEEEDTPTIFAPVHPKYSRNYMIVDTVYESAPSISLGIPGPDGDGYDLSFNGLSGVPEAVKSELPLECLEAFEGALRKEQEWKSKWNTEARDSLRRAPIIDKGVIL